MLKTLHFPSSSIQLEDGNLVLKLYLHEYLPAIKEVLQDRGGEVPRFSFDGVRAKIETEAQICQHMETAISGWKNKERIPFCIFLNGKIRGIVHLKVDLVDRRATIEKLVIDPDFQGQGIGFRTVRLLTTLAMETIGFDILCGEVAKENIPSRKVFKKCNFRCRGQLEKFYYDVTGRKNTLVFYQVSSRNWNKKRRWGDNLKEWLISDILLS